MQKIWLQKVTATSPVNSLKQSLKLQIKESTMFVQQKDNLQR